MKKILLLVSFLLIFFSNAGKIEASDNFSTSYSVIYNVSDSETTRVTLNIGLKNKTSDYYVSSYGVQTGFDNISNVAVTDGSGNLQYKTEKNDKGTSISFDFKQHTVGIGNVQKFSISFDTSEISKNFGSVWEVNIPGISKQNEYEDFTVEVRTPKSIGPLSIIKPAIFDLKTGNNSIFFSKKDLGNGGISIAYGTHQAYDFNLKYHIQNKNVFPTRTEIAIPSDNSYQDVSIEGIYPRPMNVTIDKDGNWLAQYRLLPSQNLNITVKGKARITYIPKPEELSQSSRNLYLKSEKYWETDDEQIKKLAKELKTPQNIYNYVVDNLNYDSTRVKEVQVRQGARGVLLDKKSAVCLEFTDLFVALSRAAGIPARAIEGYANTSNTADRPLSLVEDVLHAWPEYYDSAKKTWVMVDPTWENTTKGVDYFNVLDFDHFAFVIKGADSDYPIPAGGYKINKEVKDVQVTATNTFTESKPTVDVSTNFNQKYSGGLPIEGEITITNNSKVIAPSQTLKITSSNLTPETQNLYFDKIPPYGKKIIPVKFKSPSLLTNANYTIKINIGQSTIEKKIVIVPFYKNLNFILSAGGVFIGTFLLILSFIIIRSRRLHLPRR